VLLKKYHGLGNDYLVAYPTELGGEDIAQMARRICARNLGIGADGLLVGPFPSQRANFRLRIFNPDGSEAEKSGNGLRIFCRFLFDEGLVEQNQNFLIDTLGGVVVCEVKNQGQIVRVEMGRVSFWSDDVGMTGRRREVIREQLVLNDKTLSICAASVGNPHCIILDSPEPASDVRILGPQIENHPVFSNRTNVQFLTIADRKNINLMIWERGAGYTNASGSSSVAAAAAAHRMGSCDASITVHMPGGSLDVEFDEDFEAVMTGPVEFAFSASVELSNTSKR
jgi:diaminopimelate epimerase